MRTMMQHRVRALRARMSLVVILVTGTAIPASAQMSPIPSEIAQVRVESGVRVNGADSAQVMFETDIELDEAVPWIRLRFAEARLGQGSYIRITSMFDGHVQHLRAEHLRQWRMTSAYFNGPGVHVELISGPGVTGDTLVINEVVAGLPAGGPVPFTQCGPVDDRVASDVPSVCRTIPAGCTSTVYNASSCMVTAGHCLAGNDTAEFNVPISLPGGTIQHPGPEDQYAIDLDSRMGTGSGVGNDWGHFQVFPNSETGLMPYEAQGEALTPLSPVQPELPVDIRIVGYGVDSGSANQTQQISFGPVTQYEGNAVRHQADTEGGNSGSSIVNEATGMTIGIHTHGGCNTGGTGSNAGTIITFPPIQEAVASCIGIEFAYPEGLVELVDPQAGAPLEVMITSLGDDVPNPETVTLHVSVNGGPFADIAMTNLGGDLYEASIPPSDCGDQYAYYISMETFGGIGAVDPPAAPSQTYGALAGTGLVTLVEEDFESDGGFAGSGDATDGQWNRGIPVNCNRGDPPSDFDGSGQCWLTDNSAANACNSDVDNGTSTLTSPLYDATGGELPVLTYARWFSNTAGGAPNEDIFAIEISNNDGSTWLPLETVGPTGPEANGGWYQKSFVIPQVIAPTDQMRVRFSASDLINGSVVEAGVDAFSVKFLECEPADLPPAIVHDDGATTHPFSGYVDPRAESTDGANQNLGVASLAILFSEEVQAIGGGPVTAASFSVSGTGGSLPTVVAVDATNNPLIDLTLSGPVPVQQWATIVASVEDLEGNAIPNLGDQGPGVDEPDRVDIGFLPADTDQSGGVDPFDLLQYRQIVNDIIDVTQGVDEDYVDTDRNGTIEPLDLLAFRQLVNGTGNATQPWAGETLPARP